MEVHLLYSATDEMPVAEGEDYLILSDCLCNDDDHQREDIGEDTILWDKSIYREPLGYRKMLEIYFNPDQVEENRDFLERFLIAPYVWLQVIGGWYATVEEEPGPLASSFEYGIRKMKFSELLQNPLTVKSCEVF